ncbi:hypothetical protein CgunFtcFv8_014228 [Champsocephalus gunnari]|uniref:Syntaxin-16 n=1 Tax=Champsocephalus gunnari TaxID=52237 RepID=A0AAN8HZR4_CHAGU|nr:hypothetical protein CgunFtcFv8_014228 [Champsocephalus gunnari]
MATRRLTDAFLLMRNNAIQNRQILAEQELDELADDRMALVSGISLDPEAAIGVTKRLPPKWTEGIEEIQYEITRVRQKMKDLALLHDKHMNRPTLDDSSEEEHAIEITTQEITQMFHRCQRAVTGLQTRCGHCTEQEERLLRNVVSSLAQSLQELSTNFRHTQSGYLKRMKNREERSKHFFDSGPLMEEDEDLAVYDKGFTDDQLMLVEQNTVMVEEREREIRQIVQSISDLNEIFRDLAGMVVEQGTVLDRIDFNVEQACVKTEEGVKQLQKAEQYQKKNRKMLVILILFVIVMLQANVSANRPSSGWPTSLPNVLPLSWGEDHMDFSSNWDLVLCADIMYLPETFPLLKETLAHLCKNGTVAYLSSKMREEHETPGFFEEYLPRICNVELVQHDDDQNINIYKVSLKKDQ